MILCGIFVLYTGNKFKVLTNTWQYSPFSGWLLANNAMFAYRHVDSAHRKPVPEKFKVLDNMIRTYFDSTRDINKYSRRHTNRYILYVGSQIVVAEMRKSVGMTHLALHLKRGLAWVLCSGDMAFIMVNDILQYVAISYCQMQNRYYAPPVGRFWNTIIFNRDTVTRIANTCK